MKKIVVTLFAASAVGFFAPVASAQMMGGFSGSSTDWNEVVEHTLREEKEGKEIWDKFQAQEVACEDLGDEQFGVLGEYFMGQMTGDSHAAMNAMMIQAHGEDGEERIHIAMGKRLSDCDALASAVGFGGGWMPMMPMMWGFDSFGWIFMIFWWVLLISGIVALIKWLTNQSRGDNEKKLKRGKKHVDDP